MSNMKAKVDEIFKRFNVKIEQKSGDEYRCLCPLHSESNPSFSINMNTGQWMCFSGCGKGGLVKLMMKLEKCDYNTAVEQIHGKQNKYNLDVKHKGEEIKHKIATICLPDEFERIKAIGDCPKYLINRLQFDTVRHFGLGKCTEGYFENRIIIPVRAGGKEVGFIARDYSGNAAKKYLFPKGFKTKDFLYNIDGVTGDEVILCEGPFDAMAMYEKGLQNTVCIFGITVSIRQAAMLHRKGIRNVVICLDNDQEKKQNYGMIAAAELSKKFKYYFKKVSIMQLPPGRDPDECSKRELLSAYVYKKVVATKTKVKEICDDIGNR